MLTFYLTLLLAVAAVSRATLDCSKTFPYSGLTSRYNETIAHAIHSMTVRGLKLFNDRASAKNFVPTVNQDLSQAIAVLDHAPEDPVEHDFTTLTMNIIDKILSTLGNSKDGLGPHWSPVERVAHVFHMWDLWYKIKDTAWEQVQENKPSDEMCTCLASVEFNGIKDAVAWVANHYKTGTPITLLNRPIPKLVDADSWGIWKQRLLHYYTPEALRDAAMYLHCVSQFW
ncbi:uncharacterized protein LOC123529593 [Mercenaria mercenaria]|uniref:uncharacterized protein LOC123529593 n=1 Tax=Mercenaria mercenaria TaxID=6596 RepID=UPI001E1D5DE5|nr:uncharacterized protein LOC123529593 [Mercenaria mercenaria]